METTSSSKDKKEKKEKSSHKDKQDKKEKSSHKDKHDKKEKKSHKEKEDKEESIQKEPRERSSSKKEEKPVIEEEEKSESSETDASIETPKPTSEVSITDQSDDDEDAIEADELLENNLKQITISRAMSKKSLKENQKTQIKKLRVKREDEDFDDSVPWYAMRDCLLLLLEARVVLKDMVNIRIKEERIKQGELNVREIQDLLRSQKEDEETDWVTEIQELKRNLVSEVRRNHTLERELGKLDKRIALLIKNRGNIQEVIAAGGRSNQKKKDGHPEKSDTIDQRKIENYQNLFYLLQTEPKYLATLVYLMKSEHMESFLDTVILTLFGDAFSPREEYLILKLFQIAIQKEMSAISNPSDFLKADSVVPKMVITYNRRKQGLEFLKNIVGPVLKQTIQKDTNLELKPQMIYQALINEHEVSTGEKSSWKRDLTEEAIMEIKEVKDIVNTRLDQLKQICEQFFDVITKNLSKLPYGIRWICKQIRKIAQDTFKNSSEDDILKVTGYFVYYRFINLAIVTPDAFEIIEKDLTPVARKNLVAVARVLQNLFNLSVFTGQNDKWLMPLNDWLKAKMEVVRDYFTDLAEVPDPEDYLQVDKYMELFQKTKPVIIISLHEIASTHTFLQQNVEKLAKEKDDPLRVILNDLGDAPVIAREDDREIQLTLINRFKQNVEEEISNASNVYMETKELIINTFRHIPVQSSTDRELNLIDVLHIGRKHAADQKNAQLGEQIEKILENVKVLETEGLITKADNYSSFLKDIALEVANRAEVREQQRKEIKRLNQTLRNLRKHQKYLTDQIQQYKEYIENARLRHYQAHAKKKKKVKEGENPNKMGPFKFSYSALAKKGVIIDSEVPPMSRKKTTFEISSEQVGVFDIVAKIAGVAVEKMTLELDDLLERNYNNITRLELDQVTLDVNMTIHLLNKFFMK